MDPSAQYSQAYGAQGDGTEDPQQQQQGGEYVDQGGNYDGQQGADGFDEPAPQEGALFSDDQGNVWKYEGGQYVPVPNQTTNPLDQEFGGSINGAEGNAVLMQNDGSAMEDGGEDRTHRLGYIGNLCTEIVCSLGYKLFFSSMLYTTYVFVMFMAFNWLFACLFRMFSPPNDDSDAFWQSMAFFCIFYSISFVMTSVLCLVTDLMTEFWNLKRDDTSILKISYSTHTPPWFLYLCLIVMTIIVPFLWAIILTGSKAQSGIYFAQFFFFISQVITMCIVAIAFFWMFLRACVEKSRANSRRRRERREAEKNPPPQEMQEFIDQRTGQLIQVPVKPPPKVSKSWYKSMTILEEWGLDSKSIVGCTLVVVLIALPIWVIGVVMATEGEDISDGNAGWTAIGVVAFCILVAVREITTTKHRYRSGVFCIFLIGVFVMLGLVGCGSGGNPSLFGVFIVLLILSHGMCLRKLPRTLTERELQELGQAPDPDDDDTTFDPYLCLCVGVMRAVFRCCGFDKYFGPAKSKIVRDKERELRKDRVSLWVDIKVLAVMWLLFAGALICILVFGRLVMEKPEVEFSTRGEAIAASATPFSACSQKWNSSAGTIGVVDFVLLSALSYSHGTNFERDFSRLFSHMKLNRISPRALPKNLEASAKGSTVHWIDFFDDTTSTHIIAVKSYSRGISWMRTLDTWGDTLAFKAVSMFAPLVSIWPEDTKQDFINGMAFLKKLFEGDDLTQELSTYVSGVLAAGEKVILTGHGPNGGYATIVGSKHNVPVVAFNPTGTELSQVKLDVKDNGQQLSVVATRNLFDMFDGISGEISLVPCDVKNSYQDCTSVFRMARRLITNCGDKYGRNVIWSDTEE